MNLISGASGFIGRSLCQELRDREISSIGISRDHQQDQLFLSWIQQDIDQEFTGKNAELVSRCDSLIHLAWSGLPNYQDLFHIEDNLLRQYSFIKNCIQSGIKNITITGTCLEYGHQEGELTTEHDAKPNNAYALAKDCLHKMLRILQSKMDFKLKWVRLFYIYGEGQSKNTLYGQLKDAVSNKQPYFNMSKGDQIRDYLHVSQVAKFLVELSDYTIRDGIFNCCSGLPVSVLNFVKERISLEKLNIELNTGYYTVPEYEPKAFWGKPSKIFY